MATALVARGVLSLLELKATTDPAEWKESQSLKGSEVRLLQDLRKGPRKETKCREGDANKAEKKDGSSPGKRVRARRSSVGTKNHVVWTQVSYKCFADRPHLAVSFKSAQYDEKFGTEAPRDHKSDIVLGSSLCHQASANGSHIPFRIKIYEAVA